MNTVLVFADFMNHGAFVETHYQVKCDNLTSLMNKIGLNVKKSKYNTRCNQTLY